MSGNKYATYFTKKMKVVPNLVPTKISKVNKFHVGLLAYCGPKIKLETTLKAFIWLARNVETQIWENGQEKVRYESKGRMKNSRSLIRRVNSQSLTLTTRDMGVTIQENGAICARRRTLWDVTCR